MTVQRKYGRVEATFWQRPKVRKLDPREKLALIYLFTNKHSNQIGLYQLPYLYMASDLNMPLETVTLTVSKLFENGFIDLDEEYEMVWIKGWWGHNSIHNPNVSAHCAKVFEELPDCPIKERYISQLPEGFKVGLGIDDDTEIETVSKPLRNGSGNNIKDKKIKNKHTKREREDMYRSEFDTWWTVYPRKVAKPRAIESYAKLREEGVSAEVMLDGLRKAVKGWEREETEPQYVPYPSSWLNQRRFEDEGMKPMPVKSSVRPERFI